MLRRFVFVPVTLLIAMAVPRAQQDPLTVLREERAKYGAQLDTTQAGALLDATASRLGNGWGLLRKNGGNNCPQPGTGVMVSCDWLVNKNTGRGCDALGSGPDNENGGHTGPSVPQWCGGDPFDTSAWVAPTGSPSNPPPPPPPPNTDIARLLAEMEARQAAILEQLDRITKQLQAIDAQSQHLDTTLEDIKNRPIEFPPYSGRVLGQPFTLRPQK